VPAAASAEIGLRFIDGTTETRVLDALRALAPVRPEAQVQVDILSHRPAWAASEADAELLALIGVAAQRVGQTAAGRPAAGAGDTNLLGSLGLPTVDGFGPCGGGAHAVTEHASLASAMQRVDLLEALLAAVAD
jgi:glutamate carboxypeptidase